MAGWDVTSGRALAQYVQALVSITSTTKKQARHGSSSKVKGIIPKGLKAVLEQQQRNNGNLLLCRLVHREMNA